MSGGAIRRAFGLLSAVGLGWLLFPVGCGDVRSDLISSPVAGASGGAGGASGATSTPAGECASNDDCADAARRLCHPERGVCVECVTDGHCDEVGERCSDELGECSIPCDADTPCPQGDVDEDSICDTVIGFCVECRVDGDCPGDQLCRRSECTH